MSQYMSIGKVSKLKNVSIKSLRYYDQIGILKPAFVNTETNYRYYTENSSICWMRSPSVSNLASP